MKNPSSKINLSFDDVLEREDPNTFQDARSGQSSPGSIELPGISPLKKDAAFENAAKAITSGTQEILGAGALLEAPQPPETVTEPSQANSSEITFTRVRY